MTDDKTQGGAEFYLEASVCKSGCKTDDAGNCLFEVEASNENLDFQNQKVLQRALMDSKDNFLRYGVISNDHLHHKEGATGEKITCPDQIIGEPVDVRTEGGKTIVTAKLYRSNPIARTFIRLLKDGSTRIRASIGGIFPKVRRLVDGTEAVTSLVWNDLALTATPVNNTVGCAHLVKSYSAGEFVKALCAGAQTDSAAKEGGAALIEEDVRCGTVDTQDEAAKCVTPLAVFPTLAGSGGECAACTDSAGKPFSVELVITGKVNSEQLRQLAEQNREAGVVDDTLSERLAVAELVDQLGIGAIQNSEEALAFLVAGGVADDKAREYLRDIETQGGYLMKKSLGTRTRLSNILKSLKKSKGDEELEGDEIEGAEAAADEEQPGFFDEEEGASGEDNAGDFEDEDIDLDDEDLEDEDEDFDLDDEEDEELVDGTDVVKSLSKRMARLEKSMKSIARLEKSVNAIGKTVVAVGETVAGIGNARNPRIAKSYAGGGLSGSSGKVPKGVPTEKDFADVQKVLLKSVQDGEIDVYQSSKMSSEFQHAMHGAPLSSATYSFLAQRIKG